MSDHDEVQGYQNLQGSSTDYSIHEEHSGHGRGASLSDAADRGAKRSPLQEAMPVTPNSDLAPGSYDK